MAGGKKPLMEKTTIKASLKTERSMAKDSSLGIYLMARKKSTKAILKMESWMGMGPFKWIQGEKAITRESSKTV